MLLVSLKRVNHESMIFREFEEVRNHHDDEDVTFLMTVKEVRSFCGPL